MVWDRNARLRRAWVRAGWVAGLLILATAAGASPSAARAQEGPAPPPPGLVNGDMESLDADGRLTGWRVLASLEEAGYDIGAEREDVFAGKSAARIDSRGVEAAGNSFGNLMQSVDAAAYRGKRVRFRAEVKVSEASPGSRAQMWLRVDLASAGGAQRMGFFDNMGDRPIHSEGQSEEWRSYEIVGDVAPDAQSIALGVLTLGTCVVRVDDAVLELVDPEVALTGGGTPGSDPPQPFFTAWLVLPVLAVALFALGFLSSSRLGKLAFRFTFVYWMIYALPTLLGSLVPFFGGSWSLALESGPIDALVRWTAKHVLGIQHELVSAIGNGSGDTTYAHVQALACLVLSLVVAAIWSLVDALPGRGGKRAHDHRRLKDLFCSAMRFYLAATMLGYGLAKLSVVYNQFSAPDSHRLESTYGGSSPMGLLWTFMGSSYAYTAFSGSMEALSALLLVWRRTALLGALMSVGVMLNVMLLNFCYDTPVKLFSFHLVVLGALLVLPHASLLARTFLGIGPGTTSTLAFPFMSRRATWIHRGLKAYLVVMVVGLPMYEFWRQERAIRPVLAALGEWKLATLEVDGAAVTPQEGEVSRLFLVPRPVETETGWTTDYLATSAGGTNTFDKAKLTADSLVLSGDADAPGASRLIPGDYAWTVDADGLRLESTHAGAAVRATFSPASSEYLLTSRGFRWINERPFNR